MTDTSKVNLKPGDKIPVTIEGTGRRMPICQATVTEVDGLIVRFRYADDAPIFGGLTGMVRLPGWTTK